MALFSKKNLKRDNYYVYSINCSLEDVNPRRPWSHKVPWNDTFFGKHLKLSVNEFYNRIIDDWPKLNKEAESFVIPRDISYYHITYNKCKAYIVCNGDAYNEIVDKLPYNNNLEFCGFLRESDPDSEEILYEHFIFKIK